MSVIMGVISHGLTVAYVLCYVQQFRMIM